MTQQGFPLLGQLGLARAPCDISVPILFLERIPIRYNARRSYARVLHRTDFGRPGELVHRDPEIGNFVVFSIGQAAAAYVDLQCV